MLPVDLDFWIEFLKTAEGVPAITHEANQTMFAKPTANPFVVAPSSGGGLSLFTSVSLRLCASTCIISCSRQSSAYSCTHTPPSRHPYFAFFQRSPSVRPETPTALSATSGLPPLLRRDSDASRVSVAASSALPLPQLQNEIRSNLDDLRVIKAELRGAANLPPGITRSSHPGSKSSSSIRNHSGSPPFETSVLQWLRNLGVYKRTPDDIDEAGADSLIPFLDRITRSRAASASCSQYYRHMSPRDVGLTLRSSRRPHLPPRLLPAWF